MDCVQKEKRGRALLLFPSCMVGIVGCRRFVCHGGHGFEGGNVVDVGDLRQRVAVALLGSELLELGTGGVFVTTTS